MKMFMAAALLMAGVQWVTAEPRLVNGVAVIVNDKIITYKDVRRRIAPELDFLRRRATVQSSLTEQEFRETEQKLLEKTLDELVERELILNEYKNAGYEIPESYIESKIAEDIREHGDRLTLTKTLQAQGMTYESYREQVRDRIILELMWQHHVPRDPIISPFKIERYYEENKDKFRVGDQVKLRMIVFPAAPGEAESSKKLAGEVLAKLKEGAPFAEMAKLYSQGSQRASGGDWGWVERSVLREDLAEVAFTLEPGGLSDVIETADGCFLMLVEERREAHIRALAEVRDEIETTLKDQEKRRLRKQWIEKLKEKSFVRYF